MRELREAIWQYAMISGVLAKIGFDRPHVGKSCLFGVATRLFRIQSDGKADASGILGAAAQTSQYNGAIWLAFIGKRASPTVDGPVIVIRPLRQVRQLLR